MGPPANGTRGGLFATNMEPHERSVMAAQGFLELGMFGEVWREIGSLPAEMLGRADVLEVCALTYMGERRWGEALEMARRLREIRPRDPGGFIHEAYCLHELGRTREALDTLLRGPVSLHDKPVYYYNAACYRAQLGETEDALRLLGRAFQMDRELRKTARSDPDLAPLRDRF